MKNSKKLNNHESVPHFKNYCISTCVLLHCPSPVSLMRSNHYPKRLCFYKSLLKKQNQTKQQQNSIIREGEVSLICAEISVTNTATETLLWLDLLIDHWGLPKSLGLLCNLRGEIVFIFICLLHCLHSSFTIYFCTLIISCFFLPPNTFPS